MNDLTDYQKEVMDNLPEKLTVALPTNFGKGGSAAKTIAKHLQICQSHQFHLLARQDKLGRNRKECSYTNGKIDAYRNALFALGWTLEQIEAEQWGFNDNTDKL